MSKHTEGPWRLEAGRSFQTKSGSFYLSYGRDKYDNPNFKDFCELDANARLIAAAPELLEALTIMYHEAANALGLDFDPDKDPFKFARKVIAKAEGGENG